MKLKVIFFLNFLFENSMAAAALQFFLPRSHQQVLNLQPKNCRLQTLIYLEAVVNNLGLKDKILSLYFIESIFCIFELIFYFPYGRINLLLNLKVSKKRYDY